MDNPIVILGCSKSGTTLLRNLFDGHPDLFVIPTESHFFENTRHWVSYPYRSTKPTTLSFEAMKASLLHWIEYVNSVHQETTDAFTKGKWNIKKVSELLSHTKVNSLRELSDLYIRAMYIGLYGRPLKNNLRFVEKSVENTEFVAEWKSLYPDARFIHIVRNPYANLVSLRKYANQNKFPFLKLPFLAMYNSYYFLYKNKALYENYRVIRYEELLQNPEETLFGLCSFLDLEYKDSMLSPTLLGKPWQGNSTSGNKFHSISAKNINRWQSEISDFEINLINSTFQHVLTDFSYQQLRPKRGIYAPAAKEKIKEYILNRLLLKYIPRFKNR